MQTEYSDRKLTEEYILKTGEDAASNLNLQHTIFEEECYFHLNKAGLKKGAIIWDVGCGNGTMTEYFAKQIGNNGKVYAFDGSKKQIIEAKKRIKAAGLNNVTFILGDVNEINVKEYEKADIVYTRFLLMHVNNPTKIVCSFAKLLKKDGVFAMQESVMSLDKRKSSDALQEFYELLIKYGLSKKVDYNIGAKLPIICSSAFNISYMYFYTKNYKTTNNIKNLVLSRIDEYEKKLIESGVVTEKDYKNLKNRIIIFFKTEESNQSMVMCKQSYIIAKKE